MIEQQHFKMRDRFVIHRELNPQYDEDDSDDTSDEERQSNHKHWQKQPNVVAKRNARERTRVHTVNQEGPFADLYTPYGTRTPVRYPRPTEHLEHLFGCSYLSKAFVNLKYHLPSLRAHTKRVSKLKILNAAIYYIDSLVDLLKTCDANPIMAPPTERRHRQAQVDRSLVQQQTSLPYMQTLLDYPPYMCPQGPSTPNFMMNAPPTFLFPPTYQQ